MKTRPWRCEYCAAYDSYGLEPVNVVRSPERGLLDTTFDYDVWKCGICGKDWRVPVEREIAP